MDENEEPSFKRIKSGEVLDGKWRIERKLGEGGMGTVWLATDLQLDRKVAVKLLAPIYAADQDLITRFEREARMTAALEHPNIVAVYGVGHLENRPFIVMKNLEGLTVAQLIRERGSLKQDELLSLLKQIASGLDFIHRRNFIHRDIKSGNIFVSPDGHATILDFGILRSKGGADAMTRTGIVMGTPHYMAPEQALGHKDVDHRADLYALAVVAYEAMSGTLPFDGPSDLSTVQMQAHAQPPDLCERAPWVPRAVADVVLAALSKNPQDRFATAEKFVTALQDAFEGRAAKPILLTDVALPPNRAPRRMFVVGAVVLLVFGGGAAVAFWPEPLRGAPVEQPEVPTAEVTAAQDAGAVAQTAADAAAEPALLTNVDELDAARDAGQTEPVAVTRIFVADAGEPSHVRVVKKTKNGVVNVISTFRGEPYWAAVSVNGKKVGNTPLTLDLPKGRHVVRVERAGFRTVEKRINVASGGSDVLRITLKQ